MIEQRQFKHESSVLIVEDNLLNREFMVEVLSEYDTDIHIACDGLEAVDKILEQNNHYDLVLMDIQMPVMDGLTATKMIRERLNQDELPIVAVTANASTEDKEKCMSAGMNNYITKPVDLKNMREIISHFIHGEISPSAYNSAIDYDFNNVDLSRLISRMKGNTALAYRLLSDYCEQYSDIYESIDSCFNKNNYDEARTIIHTLKGISGNLALDNIYQLTLSLEKDIKDKNIESSRNLLKNITDELSTLKDACIKLKNHNANVNDYEKESIEQGDLFNNNITEVIDLLNANNFSALDKFFIIKEQLVVMSNERTVHKIEDAINHLEFKLAADMLQNLRKLNSTPK